MGVLIKMVIVLALAVVATVPIAALMVRRRTRQLKDFERGLKMVPLLIGLPPESDDREVGGRDVRDVVEENISRAQVLYNIIASTLQKGLRHQVYGQRHLSLEIVGLNGFVKFYAVVPIALLEVVKQALVSAYPAVRLEEVAAPNIFNGTGGINATIGGEMILKESFAYPIATYQDLKRDAMQAILNAVSTLEKDEGVGIQILLRPANPGWRKQAAAIASQKRKGKSGGKGLDKALAFGKELAMAFVKAPDDKSGSGGGDKPELSSLDQAILDSIDEKTRFPGFEVLIRLVTSSTVSQRSQALFSNIVASFALFDAPGKNGFKLVSAKSVEKLVTDYILRRFPVSSSRNILNAVELSTLFHFPDQRNIPTSQLERQASKQVDGPRNMPDSGLLLGYNVFRGVKKPVRLALADRQRHMYVVGQTGTGKSTFIENLALQDMLNGEGFAFVDPHGDTVDKLLAMVPKERTEDVIYFSPAEMEHPMGLNLFEFDSPDQRDFLIQEAINMLYKLYDPQHQGIMGPRYEHMFRNLALTVMSNPAGGTFIDIPKLFTDKQYEGHLKRYVTDPTVLDFWNKEMASTSDYHKSEVMGWFVSKFGAFLSNEMMRNIIGQTKSAFNLRQVMDEGKILLVNLSKGKTGELNSKLLGMIFVMKFQAAAMSRANVAEAERKDFCLYVDEFQNFSTDSFATILSEARKYHLNLVVANQFTTQLSDEVRDAVFGNMGTIVSFRVGQNDVEALNKYFAPLFEAEDLLRVPNFNTIVRTLIAGVPTQPFSMATLPPLGKVNPHLSAALKQLSAAKYGRPKTAVAKDIFSRLSTPAPSAFASPSGAPRPISSPTRMSGAAAGWPSPTGPGGQPLSPQSAVGTGSFLDEWMAKRQRPAAAATVKPVPAAIHTDPLPMTSQLGVAQTGSTKPSMAAVGPAEPTKLGANDGRFVPVSDVAPVPSVQPTEGRPTAKTEAGKTTTVSTAGAVNLRSSGDSGDQDMADGGDTHGTIYIDRDGNMRAT